MSFAMLGFAFYEMSGGDDFDSGAIREARMAAYAEEQRAREERKAVRKREVVVAEASPVFVDTDPPLKPLEDEVSRVSLNLTSLTAAAPKQKPQARAEIVQASASANEQQTSVPRNVSVITSSADTPAIIPSLIAPSEDDAVSDDTQPAMFEDIRTVSGNAVNVRGGPGTSYGVVGRMVRGDAVVILEDNGDGWVRFESMDGTTEGWMADFLLAEG